MLVEEIAEEGGSRAAADGYQSALRLVSDARHEINNSLMGIIGHLELLLAEPVLPGSVRKRAEAIFREAEKIRDRVADLSSVRRI